MLAHGAGLQRWLFSPLPNKEGGHIKNKIRKIEQTISYNKTQHFSNFKQKIYCDNNDDNFNSINIIRIISVINLLIRV